MAFSGSRIEDAYYASVPFEWEGQSQRRAVKNLMDICTQEQQSILLALLESIAAEMDAAGMYYFEQGWLSAQKDDCAGE